MLARYRLIIALVACGWAAALAACYDPQIGDGTLGCPNGSTCPRGFRCGADQRCWRVPVVDAGQSGGARPDAAGLIAGHDAGSGSGGAGGRGGVGAQGGAFGSGGASAGGSTGAGGMAAVSGVAGAGGRAASGGAGGSAGRAGGSGGGNQNGTGGSASSGGATGGGGRPGTGGTGGMVADAGTDGGGSSPLGAACTADLACASKFCVDGVCCDGLCDGQCQACNLTKPGTCSPVTAGVPIGNKRQPCPGSGACGAACALAAPRTTMAVCTFPKSDHVCASQSCAGNTLTPTAFCDGTGTCVRAAAGPCPFGLKCLGATACLSGCASAADCVAATPFCDPVDKRCTLARPVGSACVSNSDCQNRQCVDGFCCNAPCGESCQACDLAGQEGRCTSLPAGNPPHGTLRAPCDGSGACGARCDGDAPQCKFPGSESACSCPLLGSGSCNLSGGCQTLLGLCL